MEIVFDRMRQLPRTAAHWRGRTSRDVGPMAWVAVMFSKNQIFRLFPPSSDADVQWKPMHEAIAWVVSCIGEEKTKEFFPQARQAIRQAAVDGEITIRGHKSAGLMGAGGYSDVLTSIPTSYWEAAEIGVLTVEQEADGSPPHTFPHRYSGGRFGEQIILYARLRVRWDEILRKWPGP
jgi:hypothetical protein